MANSPKITFRCPAPLLERLTQICSERGVGQSTVIVEALSAYVGQVSDTVESVHLVVSDTTERVSDTNELTREDVEAIRTAPRPQGRPLKIGEHLGTGAFNHRGLASSVSDTNAPMLTGTDPTPEDPEAMELLRFLNEFST